MIEKATGQLITASSRTVLTSFLSYLHLGAWMNERLTQRFGGLQPRHFSSVQQFWAAVHSEDVHPGVPIRFYDAFLTEWVPKAPGQVWNARGPDADLMRKVREGNLLAIDSLLLPDRIALGLGSIRLPFGSDESTYAVLGLTTADAWCTDFGIPVIVSRAVYDAFIKNRLYHNAVAAEIRAVLRFGNHPLFDPDMLRSAGSDLDRPFLERITRSYDMPTVFLQVLSPLDISLRSFDSSPHAMLSCITRETRDAHITYHAVVDANEIPGIEVEPVPEYIVYGEHTMKADISDRDSVINCIGAFKRGDPMPGSTMKRLGLSNVEVLTEFDARRPVFSTAIPLIPAPWRDSLIAQRIERTVAELRTTVTDEVQPRSAQVSDLSPRTPPQAKSGR